MSYKSLVTASLVILPLGLLFEPEKSRADAESDLLRKFKQQHQNSAAELKQTVERRLVDAEYLGRADPQKALDVVRQVLGQLQEDERLPRQERQDLITRVEEQVRRFKQLVEESKPK